MCTVTFIPDAGKIYITSNRDESPGRQAKGLYSHHTSVAGMVHFPLDETSMGSWIAMSDAGRAVCLLNGAFAPFTPDPPYRMSRGQVVLSAVTEPDKSAFLDTFQFDRIAPFTLLIYEQGRLIELLWDGSAKFIQELPVDQPQIWSSVTLYPAEVRQWRRDFFEQWLLDRESFDRESIMAFHQVKRGDGRNDFIMNRNEVVKTLSVTSILLQEHSGSMIHLDLERNTREEVLVRYDR